MLLPWEYGVRNLARRPIRTLLTLAALSTVIVLVFVVVGFIRGLDKSLAVSGDDDVVLVYSVNAEENLESSSIAAQSPDLLAASLSGIQRRFGVPHVSAELYLGTRVTTARGEGGLGLVRGVTTHAPLVRRDVRLISGEWPQTGEVMVGRLSFTKIGCRAEDLAIGNAIEFEGRTWKISGHFSAGGSAFDSELWCNLADFQAATKRQDISLVALLLEPGKNAAEVALFCKRRTDLELRAQREAAYYAALQQHYKPLRWLAWCIVWLVSAAGVFAGLNLMYGAVAGRIRELATLQAIGFRRRAILVSLVQEGTLLAATASLASGVVARLFLNGLAVRFTMGAFELQIDNMAVLIGCGVGVGIGVLGTLPPAIKALRAPVAASLKAI